MTIASVFLTIASIFLSWVSTVWVLKGLSIKANSLFFKGNFPNEAKLGILGANWLPSSDDIIMALNRIVEVLTNPIEFEVIATRWREIKRFNRLTSRPNCVYS